MSDARDRILGRVRAALGLRGEPDPAQRAALDQRLERHPHGPRPSAAWNLPVRFCERALALASTVDEVDDLAHAPSAVARYLAGLGVPPVAVVAPGLAGVDWGGAGLSVSARKITDTDRVGITGAYCAIAETGTLMLLSGEATPASTSLLPETHVAIVHAARIVATLEDAWALLRKEQGRLPRAVNLVSGPSRTADIEQTLVLGAHGPYRVHIVLLRDD